MLECDVQNLHNFDFNFFLASLLIIDQVVYLMPPLILFDITVEERRRVVHRLVSITASPSLGGIGRDPTCTNIQIHIN